MHVYFKCITNVQVCVDVTAGFKRHKSKKQKTEEEDQRVQDFNKAAAEKEALAAKKRVMAKQAKCDKSTNRNVSSAGSTSCSVAQHEQDMTASTSDDDVGDVCIFFHT